ncbi:MAG TPA: hypothetical protein ENN80_10685 [Candidatus Hydrogenedentes bacterium]|nr:hypothetical protein [Candidatus Hydrogenedentota bacterium]
MKPVLATPLIALMLVACKPMTPKDKTSLDPGKPSVVAAKKQESSSTSVTLVEFAVHIKGTLDERSKAANVMCDEMVNARYRVDLATITIEPPYPEELWLRFEVSSSESFENAPVVLRASVKRDNDVLDRFGTVLDRDARVRPYDHSMELMSHIDGAPASVLIYTQAEALIMPEETDPASIDIESAQAPPARTGHIMGNPIKIVFVGREEPQPVEPATK